MTFITKKLGDDGEEIAVQYLLDNGYEILERKYVSHKKEVDIIAKSPDDVLVFVEVKTRSNDNFGEPEYALTKSKQKSIIRVAEEYLYEKDIVDTSVRFDVIGIEFGEDGEPEINHLEHAFMKW
jgi:putative endonuclease